MLFTTLATVLGLASTAIAAPAPTILSQDDIIVLKSDGTSEVMKAADFDRLELEARASSASPKGLGAAKLGRRGCEESTEFQVLSDTEFLNWDMAISPVISSLGGKSAVVSVTDGYTLSNTMTVSASYDLTVVKDFFSTSLSVSYAESWTTQQSQTLTFTVPDDQYGVIVSQPYVRRVTGNVFSGCTDSPTTAEFTSDTYTSQSYGDLSWVTGVIRLCSSASYPIPYCIGEGSHK
ncbi:hypothetical protein B0J13DRAFT_564860 [Dactylonectria estremocensis]|uniref:Celp0028 effector like protein n=1 Tax=Dactylonectria estremocensis TaxID=1079267 RepID=A0A9P9DZV2_9HYPO|nr:hypothetical protein B0J13DRAFT_564860 [Dactylonectria estremocensis]